MTLWQIAAKNVWQNRGRYLSYLGSAAFSVMVYFLYTAMAGHPGLQSSYQGMKGVVLAQGMKAAAVVIAIFTFLFLLYANSAFIQSRMKEFGLLSLMGVTRRQLVGMILWESLFVAAVALLSGLGLGALFLKLFFMAISVLLRLPEQIPIYAGLPVWLQTLAVFGSFFLLVSLLSLRGVLRRNVVELIRAGRQPKATPSFSRWKAALGLLLVVGGYAWASAPNQVAIVLGIIPVTTMVSIGTYFLMRESSIAFLQWLHRQEHYFHRPGPFLNISQLMFKMQDNYRVLADVAILVAVILSAIGTVVSGLAVVTADTVNSAPQAVQLVRSGAADLSADMARVDSVLRSHGVERLTSHTLQTRPVRVEEMDARAVVIPHSLYTATRQDHTELAIHGPGEAILIYPAKGRKGEKAVPFDDQVIIGEERLNLHLLPDIAGRFFNEDIGTLFTLVVPDERFAELMTSAPEEERLAVAFWTGPEWNSQAMEQAVTELRTLYPREEGQSPSLSTTLESYDADMTSFGIALFIGSFVSLVFFAACCSLIYFRLFTEIEDDRKYYRRLQQLGASDRELRRLAREQSMVIFFVPFIVGLVHSTFAMKALGTLLRQTVLQYGWAVAAAYLLLYVVYFVASSGAYWRSVRAGLSGSATEMV